MDRRDSAAEGELELRRPQPLWMPVVFGAAVLASMGAMPLVVLGGPVSSTSALVDLALLLSPVAALWVAWAIGTRRLARTGRVSWDGWGLYEWEGSETRTAIAWAGARVELDHAREVRAPRDGSIAGARVFDDAGRCISLLTPASALPDWPLARPCVAPSLEPLHARLRALPSGVAPPDLRDRLRPTALWMQPRVVFPIIALSSIACAWVPLVLALFAVALLGALVVTAIPAAVELARLLQAAWRMRGARALTLLRLEGTTVVARDRDAREVRLDARGWTVSDASLAVRPRGLVFAKLGALATVGGPYRGAPPGTRVLDLAETPLDRRARLRRAAGAALELAARIALLAGVVTLGWTLIVYAARMY